MLSRDDIQAIAGKYQVQGIDFEQNLFDKLPEHDYRMWNEKTYSQVHRDIANAFINYWGTLYYQPISDLLEFNFTVGIGYFGTYTGSHVFLATYKDWALIKYFEDTISGFTFAFPDYSHYIYVWKNRTLYTLPNAFALGLLTLDDIQNIHEMYIERGSKLSRNSWPRPINGIIKE